MKYYQWLEDDDPFPPVETADQYGVLCLGGDLSTVRLLDAYSKGIFPWYEEDQPIIWHAPDPRFVLFPDNLAVSRSMRQVLKRNEFEITFDRSFFDVMLSCAAPRRKQQGTWITSDMLDAYCELHNEGYAHSVEAWKDGRLAGGLYGVSLGKIFFGESMFSLVPNASKAAFITLMGDLKAKGFELIDSQVYTDHLSSLGAENISRDRYCELLKRYLSYPTDKGKWAFRADETGE
jgi:leucyl/phenylalanyl-tRNA--protein transferase